MSEISKKEEMEKRIKKFTIDVLKTIKTLPRTEENIVYIRQILRSSSSIGANYAEAVYAQTRQEFLHCLSICRKETNETLYWLGMLYSSNPQFNKELEILIEENKQLLRIFISSVKTTRAKMIPTK